VKRGSGGPKGETTKKKKKTGGGTSHCGLDSFGPEKKITSPLKSGKMGIGADKGYWGRKNSGKVTFKF